MHRKPLLTAALAAPMALVAFPAAAAEETAVVLTPVGDAEGAGTAELALDEVADTLGVRMAAEGLQPELPLASYLTVGGEGICPPDGAATGAEAAEFVGAPVLLLSTAGDVAPEPVVDVDRVPVVTADGEVVLERTYDLAELDPFPLEDAVVVSYAVTDPETPVDELAPVLCGAVTEVSADSAAPSATPAPTAPTPTPHAPATGTDQVEQVPVGGVQAGGGGTAGIEHEGLFALGGAALAGAGALALRRRRAAGTR